MKSVRQWQLRLFLCYYVWRCNRHDKAYIVRGKSGKPVAMLVSCPKEEPFVRAQVSVLGEVLEEWRSDGEEDKQSS